MKIPLLAIDSMLFIYHLESYQSYVGKTTKLFKDVYRGKSHAVTSVVSLIETLSAPKLEQDPEKVDLFTRFFYETHNLTTVDVSGDIAQEAALLRRRYITLRTPDSIQLATAIVKNAQIFVTNDKKLQNLKLPVKIKIFK